MEVDSAETIAERLKTAFDLFLAGERMMRQNLKRRHPEATLEEIEHRLCAWMSERPGAEHGDAVARPIPWPRKSV
jgi:hypothetical protein